MTQITFKKIKEVANKIVKEFQPEKIILFGSFIWGKPTSNSDVDLLLIKNSKMNKHLLQVNLGRILFGNGVPMDTLIYTPKEIENRLNLGDFFINDIIKKGKIIYEKK